MTSRSTTCFTQSCEQIITGRNLYYDRIIEILQTEEYLSEANLESYSEYELDDQLLLPRNFVKKNLETVTETTQTTTGHS